MAVPAVSLPPCRPSPFWSVSAKRRPSVADHGLELGEQGFPEGWVGVDLLECFG